MGGGQCRSKLFNFSTKSQVYFSCCVKCMENKTESIADDCVMFRQSYPFSTFLSNWFV